jgi:hypothetical protein
MVSRYLSARARGHRCESARQLNSRTCREQHWRHLIDVDLTTKDRHLVLKPVYDAERVSQLDDQKIIVVARNEFNDLNSDFGYSRGSAREVYSEWRGRIRRSISPHAMVTTE